MKQKDNTNTKSPKYIVGDLVTFEGEVFYIEEVIKTHFNTYSYSNGTNWFEEEYVKPISITPEILKKNGWKKPDGFKSYWFDNVGLLQNNDKWEVAIGTTGLAFKITNIKSISDLQHLLFGLGLNSNIKL